LQNVVFGGFMLGWILNEDTHVITGKNAGVLAV